MLRLNLWILFIFIAIFSIPSEVAQAGTNGPGAAFQESGRFHPRAGVERQTFLSPYLTKSGSTLSDPGRRLPQATGEITCGSEWGATQRFDALNAVVYGAGLYVAVGVDGTIQTSPDGITWTRRTSGVTASLEDVTWGGNQFVAVGSEYISSTDSYTSTILTSPDGVTWTPRTSGITNGLQGLQGVTWGGNQFVAVGDASVVLTSPDGVTWTPRTSGVTAWLEGVTWGGNQFVAVGDSGAIRTILTSPDGVTWTNRALVGIAINYFLHEVTWGGNQFVAVGEGTILTSPDGVTWTPSASGGGVLWGVTWGGNQFVAVGDFGTIQTSPDGITWTRRTAGVTYPWRWSLRDVTWGGNQFVAVGYRGVILTSPDGVTWTPRTSGVTGWLSGVTWGGNQFVAVGDASVVLTSPDGVTWTPRESGVTLEFQDVTWGGNQFVAVGTIPPPTVLGGGRDLGRQPVGDGGGGGVPILTSPDGVTWTPRASGVTTWLGLEGVTWSGNQFVAVGWDGAILTSPDGITWTPRASGVTTWLEGVTWGGNQFVAVGSGGTILTSPDGITWTPRTSGVTFLNGVTWGGNQFVAVGSGILTSPDGVTWIPRVSGVTSSLSGVAWGVNQFMAVGDSILASPDGVTWTRQPSGTNQYLYDVAGNGRQWVAVGGIILCQAGATTGGASFSVMNHASRILAYTTGLNSLGQLGAGLTSTTAQAHPQASFFRKIYPVRVRWSARRTSQSPAVAPLATTETPDFIALASATAHTIALRGDGSVWAWGDNTHGQLGDGTTTIAYEPVPVLSDSNGTPLNGVVAIAAGRDHSVAVKSDGTVWTWGSNADGQLGDNSDATTTRLYPVQVVTSDLKSLTGVKTVTASDVHTIALKTDGTVWAWGNNVGGYLGTGDTTPQRTAVPVPGLTEVQAIQARGTDQSARTLVQGSDGSLWGWGDNRSCQLGDTALGATILTPTPLTNLSNLGMSLGNVAQGDFHGIARVGSGTAWTWGDNRQGQLGDGTTTSHCTPVPVPGLSQVETVGAGVDHSLVTLTDGWVWGWGNNDNGQLGVGDTTSRLTPTQMKGENGVGFLNLKTEPTALTTGDVNGDGLVNALDVVAVINAVLGIQPLPAAEVNGDGNIDALDVVFVINRVLGL